MEALVLPAAVLIAIGYVGVVIYKVLTSASRGGILNVLTSGVLFRVALSFLALGIVFGLVFLGGSAGAIAGSGGTAETRQLMDTASDISVFCLFASLALAVTAMIRHALRKNAL